MKNSGKTEISKKPLAQLEIEEYRPQFPHIYESEWQYVLPLPDNPFLAREYTEQFFYHNDNV